MGASDRPVKPSWIATRISSGIEITGFENATSLVATTGKNGVLQPAARRRVNRPLHRSGRCGSAQIVAIREMLLVERETLIDQRHIATRQADANIAFTRAGKQDQPFGCSASQSWSIHGPSAHGSRVDRHVKSAASGFDNPHCWPPETVSSVNSSPISSLWTKNPAPTIGFQAAPCPASRTSPVRTG